MTSTQTPIEKTILEKVWKEYVKQHALLEEDFTENLIKSTIQLCREEFEKEQNAPKVIKTVEEFRKLRDKRVTAKLGGTINIGELMVDYERKISKLRAENIELKKELDKK